MFDEELELVELLQWHPAAPRPPEVQLDLLLLDLGDRRDPEAGVVRLDGVDLRDLARRDFRRAVRWCRRIR